MLMSNGWDFFLSLCAVAMLLRLPINRDCAANLKLWLNGGFHIQRVQECELFKWLCAVTNPERLAGIHGKRLRYGIATRIWGQVFYLFSVMQMISLLSEEFPFCFLISWPTIGTWIICPAYWHSIHWQRSSEPLLLLRKTTWTSTECRWWLYLYRVSRSAQVDTKPGGPRTRCRFTLHRNCSKSTAR